MPHTPIGMADDKKNKNRKSKLDAIGTLLEKAVVTDPYRAPNAYVNIPTVFVNQKLYGKATHDDPVNSMKLVKNLKYGSTAHLHTNKSTVMSVNDYGRKTPTGRSNTAMSMTGDYNDGKSSSLKECFTKTDFRTSMKRNNHE